MGRRWHLVSKQTSSPCGMGGFIPGEGDLRNGLAAWPSHHGPGTIGLGRWSWCPLCVMASLGRNRIEHLSSEKLQQRIFLKSELSLESSRIIDRIQRERWFSSDTEIPRGELWRGATDVCYLKRLVTTHPKRKTNICRGIPFSYIGFSFSTLYIPLFKMGKCIIPCQIRLPKKSQKIQNFPAKTSASFSPGTPKALVVWHVVFRVQDVLGVWSLGLCIFKNGKTMVCWSLRHDEAVEGDSASQVIFIVDLYDITYVLSTLICLYYCNVYIYKYVYIFLFDNIYIFIYL